MKLQPVQNTLIVIAGPTASGKTGLAVKVAKQFNAEIISADSRQFYKEIPIGTAAPSKKIQQEVKHYFVGNLSISEDYNVSRYEHDVLKLLKKSFQKRPVMVLVGGSGLYIDAVCNGIDELPDADAQVRKDVQKLFENSGLSGLQAELKKLDSEYFSVVDVNNPVRVMRALEVCLQTGKKYSELRQNVKKQRDFNIIKIAVDMPRQILNDRINVRVDQMVNAGLFEEVKAAFLFKNFNSMNTVGYKELFNVIEGKWEYEYALEKIKTNTRRYAKRQMTWFRKNKEYTWFSPDEENKIFQFISEKLCC